MKLYDFYKKETGEFFERKKCSRREAEVFAHNFNLKFEEHKRGKHD